MLNLRMFQAVVFVVLAITILPTNGGKTNDDKTNGGKFQKFRNIIKSYKNVNEDKIGSLNIEMIDAAGWTCGKNFENSNDYNFTQLAQEVVSNDKKSTLIDLDNFEYIIERNTCHKRKPTLLVMIVSAPSHFVRRKVLRDTWAKNTKDVAIIFLLGNSEKYNNEIKKENEQFEDILQGNFDDSYKNLTYKSVMAFKWMTYYCSDQVQYVLKVDDDMYVNLDKFINSMKSSPSFVPSTQRLLWCIIHTNCKPQRIKLAKHYVSKDDYPFPVYPTYCDGPFVFFTTDSMILLYREAQKTPYYWIEDVHTTGTLAKQVGLKHTSIQPYRLSKWEMTKLLNGIKIDNRDFLIGSYDLGDKEIESLHKYVKKHNL